MSETVPDVVKEEKEPTSDKEKFLELVISIEREYMDKELLLKQLNNSDFFTAPASVKYHDAEEGGLCRHSLAVYQNLLILNESFGCEFDETSMKIVALFHDFSKMNFYKKGIRNKKIYSDTGSKRDEMGRYDWVSVPSYEVREAEDRFVFGSHEENAAFMINSFIPLTMEEYCAILHHHGGHGWDSAQDNIMEAYHKYPLAFYLHTADMMAVI